MEAPETQAAQETDLRMVEKANSYLQAALREGKDGQDHWEIVSEPSKKIRTFVPDWAFDYECLSLITSETFRIFGCYWWLELDTAQAATLFKLCKDLDQRDILPAIFFNFSRTGNSCPGHRRKMEQCLSDVLSQAQPLENEFQVSTWHEALELSSLRRIARGHTNCIKSTLGKRPYNSSLDK